MRVITANVYAANKRISADVEILRSLDADVIGVQEGHPWIAELRGVGNVRVHNAANPGSREVPVILRTGLPFEFSRSLQMCNATTHERTGKERWATVVRCDSGIPVSVINTHFDAGLAWPSNMREYVKHKNNLVALSLSERARGRTLLLTADWNHAGRVKPPLDCQPPAIARELGLVYVGHGNDGVMYDPTVWRAGPLEPVTPKGADHTWHYLDLTPIRKETPVSGLCPFAVHKLIPAGDNDPPIKPRIAVLHVDVGNAESLYDYFNGPSGGVESHFHIKRSGEVEQYRNIFRQADANLNANDFAVSIETQGFGEGEWTPEQLASIKRLLRWLHKETEGNIPLIRCTAWDGKGVGYHVMFGAPGPWTPSAKTCPGPKRIVQYESVLIPWMRALAEPVENRVTRGRDLIEQGLALWDETPITREVIHTNAARIRTILEHTPEA